MQSGRDWIGRWRVAGAARPTVADVARLADVSTATVSYVLNNTSGRTISAPTRETVLRAARMLGYRPNLAARNLARGASGVILYIVPRMALGQLPVEVGSRLTTALAAHGIVQTLQFETEDNRNVLDAIEALHPIAVTSMLPLQGPALAAVDGAGIPNISLGSGGLNALSSLDVDVGEIRVAHLVERGHRRLAFAYSGVDRLRILGDYWLTGIEQAVRKRGLPDVDADTLAVDGADAAQVVRAWADRGVTAVCAQTDDAAFVVLHGIREAGLRCPHDLAVIGVDTGPAAAVSAPPLTSVAFDAAAIVDIAVPAMMAELGFPAEASDTSPAIASLVMRRST
jgi:DNA-binding LacI/PurR family transcriptional regulator